MPVPDPHQSLFHSCSECAFRKEKKKEEEAQLTSIAKHFYTTEKLTISVRVEKPQTHGVINSQENVLSAD